MTDDDIDALIRSLFDGLPMQKPIKPPQEATPKRLEEISDQDLLRIRSRNHPDKWPNANLDAYQAAVKEMDRRRHDGNLQKQSVKK